MNTHEPTDSGDLSTTARGICYAEGLSFLGALGSGAFKQVFRVGNSRGASFALKILRDPTPSERAVREAEALRRCDHRGVARLHKFATYKDGQITYTYTLEEFLAGGTLMTRVDATGPLPREKLVEIGRGLINALGYIATRDLVHRDIKPENIMFRDSGDEPVLVDFGLVRDLAASSLTQTWAVRGPGTPYFAAPEQLTNQKRLIDWRTDQFSLAVSLAFCRYGRHPYQSDDEPPYSSATVERAAARGPRSTAFLAMLESDRLSCLTRMTDPWPIGRFRRPVDLSTAWEEQGA